MFLKILFVLQLFLLLFNFATLTNHNELISIKQLPNAKFLNMKLDHFDLNEEYRKLKINIEISNKGMENKFIFVHPMNDLMLTR